MYINNMLPVVPKLKLMGLMVFTGCVMQILALACKWFTMYGSGFSLKAVSDTYYMDMLGKECSTIEDTQGLRCYCSKHCDLITRINSNGWACAILVLIAVNCFIVETFSIRRKIWRCEGVNLPMGLIDNDIFMVVGTIAVNIATCIWSWQIVQVQEKIHEIELARGIKIMVAACVIHIIATMYFFIRIRSEARPRES